MMSCQACAPTSDGVYDKARLLHRRFQGVNKVLSNQFGVSGLLFGAILFCCDAPQMFCTLRKVRHGGVSLLEPD